MFEQYPIVAFVILLVIVFLGSIICGSIPLCLKRDNSLHSMNSSSSRKAAWAAWSLFGSGLLLGTALAVMIPEGIETLYNHYTPTLEVATETFNSTQNSNHTIVKRHFGSDSAPVAPQSPLMEEPHRYIGLALLAGFIVMLIVERAFSTHGDHHNSSSLDQDGLPTSANSSVTSSASTSANATPLLTPSRIPSDWNHIPSVSLNEKTQKSFLWHPVVMGIMIHSASDGIALGAAALVDSIKLEWIVFLALMLHKGPAALGFVSYLLHQDCPRTAVKCYLAAFAAAAPLGATLTYGIMQLATQHNAMVLQQWTGLILLVSAGIFLYVATLHILPECLSALERNGKKNEGSNWVQVAFLILGMILPFILSSVADMLMD